MWAFWMPSPSRPAEGPTSERASLRGKFVWVGREKLRSRGVTYVTFVLVPPGVGAVARCCARAVVAMVAQHRVASTGAAAFAHRPIATS